MSSMMVDGLTKSSRSSGPQVRMMAAVPSWPSLTISSVCALMTVSMLHRRLDLEEVVEPGMADQLGVDDVAAEGADAVQVALRDVLDDEARDVVGEQVVADAPVGQRTGDQIGGIADASGHGAGGRRRRHGRAGGWRFRRRRGRFRCRRAGRRRGGVGRRRGPRVGRIGSRRGACRGGNRRRGRGGWTFVVVVGTARQHCDGPESGNRRENAHTETPQASKPYAAKAQSLKQRVRPAVPAGRPPPVAARKPTADYADWTDYADPKRSDSV